MRIARRPPDRCRLPLTAGSGRHRRRQRGARCGRGTSARVRHPLTPAFSVRGKRASTHGSQRSRWSSRASVRAGSPETTASTGSSSAPVDRPHPSAPLSCMERDSGSATASFHGCSSAVGPIARRQRPTACRHSQRLSRLRAARGGGGPGLLGPAFARSMPVSSIAIFLQSGVVTLAVIGIASWYGPPARADAPVRGRTSTGDAGRRLRTRATRSTRSLFA